MASIGISPLYRVLALMFSDASTPAEWPRLQRIEREAALAVRLANDLRTYERELREQAVNAVLILSGSPDASGLPASAAVPLARAEVQARMDQALDRCAALCHPIFEASTRVEDVFLRFARFTCAFYQVRDFAD